MRSRIQPLWLILFAPHGALAQAARAPAPAPAVAPAPAPSIACSDSAHAVGPQETATIRDAGATIGLPSPVSPNLALSSMGEEWDSQQRSGIRTAVLRDSTHYPFSEDEGSPPSLKLKSTRCDAMIGGKRSFIATYYEATAATLPGRYVAAGAYELVPGGWLLIGTASKDADGQRAMLAALRSVRFMAPFGSTERRPLARCPVGAVAADASHTSIDTLRSAPATFVAASGAHLKKGYAGEAWDVGGMRVDFVPLGTDGFALVTPEPTRVEECAFTTAGGLKGELTVTYREWTPEITDISGIAYVQLSPGHMLEVFAYLFHVPNGPARFRTLVSTLRPLN